MHYVFSKPFDRGDVLNRIPVPERVDPRTYLVCNRIEAILEENGRTVALRYFVLFWRQRLIPKTFTDLEDFRSQSLVELHGSRVYGPWWGPGRLPRRLTDSLRRVRQVIEFGDFQEIFE